MNIRSIGLGALDLFAAFLVAHMVWYGFTGTTPVASFTASDGWVRMIILVALHLVVPAVAILRRCDA